MNDIFDYWQLLLIPLFFALGWAAARVDMRQVVHESRALPRSYFQGLNFLLNEQPDKAIDAFLEVAKVDPQMVELHFGHIHFPFYFFSLSLSLPFYFGSVSIH